MEEITMNEEYDSAFKAIADLPSLLLNQERETK